MKSYTRIYMYIPIHTQGEGHSSVFIIQVFLSDLVIHMRGRTWIHVHVSI